MHTFSVSQLLAVGLLVAAPLASAYPTATQGLAKKDDVSIEGSICY